MTGSPGPGGHPGLAQLPVTLPPQGTDYLRVGEVDTVVPSVGCAPWEGDHSGSPEAVPADPCGWVSKEAPQGPQPKANSPQPGRGKSSTQGHLGTSKKKIWFPSQRDIPLGE